MQLALHSFVTALGLLIAVGSSLWIVMALTAAVFARMRARERSLNAREFLPPVTLLKPVCGLEKNLRENLRSACLQDYPAYEVVFSAQRENDPAIPLLWELKRELESERVGVSVVVEEHEVGLNGKINNLSNALPHARYDILVISDSDVRLRSDYLKTIVAPLADPAVGGVSTFFKASDAGPWYEQMEQLTINADHFAVAQLAYVLRLTDFCFGASFAMRRELLEQIGGLAPLGDYLVEDHELGQRVLGAGKKLAVVPYVVDTMVDLRDASQWWTKATYWDQNTKAAIPGVFVASFVLRIIPLALLFALLRGFDRIGVEVLLGSIALRLVSTAIVLAFALRDFATIRALWLVPVKDVLGVLWFARAFLQRTVVWRGVEMVLTSDGRLRPLHSERPT